MKDNVLNKKYFINKILKNTLHKTIIVEITRKCHKFSNKNNEMGCMHCFQEPLAQQSITIEEIDRIINLSKNYFHTIGIVGGEPFLEIEKIYFILNKYPNHLINVFTCGETLTKEQIIKLSKYDNLVLSITLNGLKHHHDYLAGMNSYERVIERIRLINLYKIKWIRMVVANSQNIEYLLSPEFDEENNALKCESIDVVRYYPVGPKVKSSLKLNEANYQLLNNKLIDLTKKGFGIYQEGYGKKCRAMICVDILGNLLPCPYAKLDKWNMKNILTENDFLKSMDEAIHFWKSNNTSKYYCNQLQNYF